MSGYVRGLDGMRGIGIFFVLFTHYFCNADNQLLAFSWGWLEMFFVQSGFLITRILLEDRRRFEFSGFVRRFYWRRALRIFPAYFGFVGLATLCWMLFRVPPNVDRHLPYLLTYTYNFTRLKRQLGSAYFNPFWSLAVEEQFYFIWPFVVYFMSTKQLKRLLLGIIVGAPLFRYVLAQLLLSHGYFATGETSHTVGEIVYGSTFGQFDGFAFGAAIPVFGLTDRIKKPRAWMIAATALLFSIGIANHEVLLARGIPNRLASLGMPVGRIENLQHVWSYTLVDAFWVLVIVNVLSVGYRGVFNARPLVWVGKIVYGVYIVHMAALMLAREVAERMNVEPALAFLGGTAVAITAAYLSYTYFESRFLKMKDMFGVTVRKSAAE